MTDTTRAFFAKAGAARGDDLGHAMVALSKNPGDKAAEAIVSKDRGYHSMLRTTCVATLLEGGHANNALPQRAAANVNCRIFPGESVESTRRRWSRLSAMPASKSRRYSRSGPSLCRRRSIPRSSVRPKRWLRNTFPGVPLIPSMSTGATDGIFLEAIGIPVYGAPGGWGDPDGNGAHGLNERRSVRSVYIGRDFLTDLVKAYAD